MALSTTMAFKSGARRPRSEELGPTYHGPVPLTGLIGRQTEVEDARRSLLDTDTRLLTLTGAPGAGKTRLALAVAQAVHAEFPDGVWFVPLAPLQRPDLVLPTIAQVLGVRQAGRRALLETLTRTLRDRRLLLVLDNVEHVLPAAPALVGLLAACPDLRLLATSRAPLRVSGEHRLDVAPLALPALEPLPSLVDLAQVPSVRLLIDRAAAVSPGFTLSPVNARAVAELCVRLDGLPLAIELAAARCRLLEPSELLARLDRRLALLDDGPRDAPPRQRALRAAIDWSYELLAPAEQRLLCRLGVFAGGCTIEAAQAVAVTPDEPAQEILEGIGGLLDHSLLRKEPDPDGYLRVGMLESMRAFALEQLAAQRELESTQRRHALFYVSLAEQAAAPRLDGPKGPALVSRLEREHDNLRAALRWLLDHGDVERGVQLAGALWSFWEVRGHLSEGVTWLDAALASERPVSPVARARALIGAAALRRERGDYATAAASARESATIRRAVGDQVGLAESLLILAHIVALGGDPAEASALAGEALAIRRQRGDTVGMAWAMAVSGLMLMFQGDFSAARVQFEEALALRHGQRDNMVDGWLLRGLGVLVGNEGDATSARRLLEQALDLFGAHDDVGGMGAALLGLGDLAVRQGDRAAGRACLEEAGTLLAQGGQLAWFAIASLRLERPVPGRLLEEIGPSALAGYWRGALGRDLRPSVATGAPTETGAVTGTSTTGRDPVAQGLTSREREVLGLVARHYTNREVAEELVLSIRTVE
ncbi:MAG: AAA family ATPase, partial [Chloroflexi bacterium]|nr:AAA family ATPase [Chloroflexota bacterium]